MRTRAWPQQGRWPSKGSPVTTSRMMPRLSLVNSSRLPSITSCQLSVPYLARIARLAPAERVEAPMADTCTLPAAP
ncbi:hypothetical protein ACFQS7_24435 [Dankookia sp. GCM10030260]|uniref:hypothetical protein n=1 Tax=Dankookia sp. GCM10030260 TaxID=3273390 RepID=UPI00361F7234